MMADDRCLIREMNDEQQLLQLVRLFAVCFAFFSAQLTPPDRRHKTVFVASGRVGRREIGMSVVVTLGVGVGREGCGLGLRFSPCSGLERCVKLLLVSV